MSSPLVSIYIPTHNRVSSLRRAVESALTQSYPAIEVIVVDDASTDGTEALMREWETKDARLRYIRLESRSGANVARNTGIRAAKGKYLTGLDDDDIMLPKRVERLLSVYSDDLAFVSSDYYVEDRQKRKRKRLTRKTWVSKEDLLFVNVVGNQVLTSREKFFQAGLFDESLLAGQDIDMWIRLFETGAYARILHEPLQVVRIGDHSRISSSPRQIKGYWQVYSKHRKKMSRSQRKYRLLGLKLAKKGSLRSTLRLLPVEPKFFLYSLVKVFRYEYRRLYTGARNRIRFSAIKKESG